MKIKLLTIILVLLILPIKLNAQAWLQEHQQEVRISNPNLYFHVDLNSGNIYTMGVSTIVLGYLNYGLKRNIFETAYMVDFLSAKQDGNTIKNKMFSPIGLRAADLFNTISPKLKIGYKSNNSGNANWGVYALANYKLHQFKLKFDDDDYDRMRYSRLGFGAGIIGIFGDLTAPYHVIIEGEAYYNIPLTFSTSFLDNHSINQLNRGLTSHFAIKFGGSNSFQNIGIFVDIDHFNLVNEKCNQEHTPIKDLELRNISVGISLSVTLGQSEKR